MGALFQGFYWGGIFKGRWNPTTTYRWRDDIARSLYGRTAETIAPSIMRVNTTHPAYNPATIFSLYSLD